MAPRVTRRSATQHSTLSNSDKENVSQPSTNSTQGISQKETAPKKNLRGKSKQLSAKIDKKADQNPTNDKEAASKKRKHSQLSEAPEDFEELPHNLGRIPRGGKKAIKEEKEEVEPSNKKATTKRSIRAEETEDPPKTAPATAAKKSGSKKSKAEQAKDAASAAKDPDADGTPQKASKGKKQKTTKTNEYGLIPGISPFPDYPHPTPEECHAVAKLLRERHPDCHPRPKTIPAPSQIVAGCGEVPSILDALVRTLLSAATTGRNSSSAYQGMVARYGNRETGVGKGSVDYNAVRLASQKELENAIASGGLAHSKSKNIKAILDMVYAENQERRRAHLAGRSADSAETGPKGAEMETEEQANAEIQLAEENILSLDHYYTLPTYDAIFTFVKYPGIGVKTAACVALFCMQRDCFAVDTHVFRLCKWLGWLPPDDKKVTRDTAFSHLEVRIPDELKYDLHQLLINHGKKCPRCRASTGESSAKWEEGCVIDHLVTRSGPRKMGGSSPVKKSSAPKSGKTKTKTQKGEDGDNDDEDIDMPDLGDDEEGDDGKDEPTPEPEDKEEQQKAPLKAAKGKKRKVSAPKNNPTTTAKPAEKSTTPKKSAAAPPAASRGKKAAKGKGKGRSQSQQ